MRLTPEGTAYAHVCGQSCILVPMYLARHPDEIVWRRRRRQAADDLRQLSRFAISNRRGGIVNQMAAEGAVRPHRM